MYKDLRIRNANRCTPIPPSYRAFIFRYNCIDRFVYKVIVAPNLVIANQRLRDFTAENDLDFFWEFVSDDDFEVAFSNNVVPVNYSR